jgi:hypothetical protein
MSVVVAVFAADGLYWFFDAAGVDRERMFRSEYTCALSFRYCSESAFLLTAALDIGLGLCFAYLAIHRRIHPMITRGSVVAFWTILALGILDWVGEVV